MTFNFNWQRQWSSEIKQKVKGKKSWRKNKHNLEKEENFHYFSMIILVEKKSACHWILLMFTGRMLLPMWCEPAHEEIQILSGSCRWQCRTVDEEMAALRGWVWSSFVAKLTHSLLLWWNPTVIQPCCWCCSLLRGLQVIFPHGTVFLPSKCNKW